MNDVELACRCGKIKAVAKGVGPHSKSRVICSCRSCQAFAEFLHRKTEICDQHGGTDIYQMTPSQLQFTEGKEFLACVRLSAKGTYRWYADCCKTAIANTALGSVPFVGLVLDFVADKKDLDAKLGPVKAYYQARYAEGEPQAPKVYPAFPPGTFIVIIFTLLKARLTGKHRPNPFFTERGEPVVEPIVLGPSS